MNKKPLIADTGCVNIGRDDISRDDTGRDDASRLLSSLFGHSRFRPGQRSLVDAIIAGQDVIGILPTGGGKSLCYQLPALLLPGLTLVVSPLIALMTDQVEALKAKGVASEALHASLPASQRRRIIDLACGGDLKLLYLSPERLVSPAFEPFLRRMTVSLISIDEAHCLSTWGDDFRPSYRAVGTLLRNWPGGNRRPPVCAVTASATPAILFDISQSLGLVRPFTRIFSFDRPNLFFGVLRTAHKGSLLLTILSHYPNQCGIIYCQTRQSVNALTRFLNREGFPALPYHAGLDKAVRETSQMSWTRGEMPLIVATNAFGMGIDKPDVRFVIHYQMPGSMEAYYQEAGRAGRDGKGADCLLLVSDGDLVIQDAFLRQAAHKTAASGRSIAFKNLSSLHTMMIYAGARTCLRRTLLTAFGETPAFLSCRRCSVCLEAAAASQPGASQPGRPAAPIPPSARFPQKKDPAPVTQLRSPDKFLPRPSAPRSDRAEDDLSLFRHLKALRSLLLKNRRTPLPKFLVRKPLIPLFSESELRTMAGLKPVTWPALLTLPDISVLKALRWGGPFLKEIRIWLMSRP